MKHVKNYHTALSYADSYKWSHMPCYPNGTKFVCSNITARRFMDPRFNRLMVFGTISAINDLKKDYDDSFFALPKDKVIENYSNCYREHCGTDPLKSNIEKITELWEYQRLPLDIYSLPEGSACPAGVPFLIIRNSDERFHWVTNLVETYLSASIWKRSTVATISAKYRQQFEKFAKRTSDNEWFTEFQGHDFSMRGLSCVEDSVYTGMSWLTNSKGSDTLTGMIGVMGYYDVEDDEVISMSVPASEHSIQSSFLLYSQDTKETDRFYLKNMLENYPTGIVSVVADGFDFWRFVTEILSEEKDLIMSRNGKLVVRPDSSPNTPVEIIVGDPTSLVEHERKGLIECLWDIFGGTVNSKGYKELDSHIGAIYGDSITLDYQQRILEGLEKKGFATTNVVLGIGSYSLQYLTRDSFGMAMKATAIEVGDQVVSLYKDPKTDKGTKKSARGYLKVAAKGDSYELIQEVPTWEESLEGSAMLPLMLDGKNQNTCAKWSTVLETFNQNRHLV